MAAKKPLVLNSYGEAQQIQTGDFVPVASGGTGAVDAAGARSNLGVVPGTDVQVYSAQLTNFAALALNGLVSRTGANTFAARTLTSTVGLTVTNGDGISANPQIDLATLTDAGGGSLLKFSRDAYGRVSGSSAVVASDLTGLLGSTYLKADGTVSMAAALTLSGDPTNALHAATKQYVDNLVQGAKPKNSVRAATTANIATLAGGAPSTLDGIPLAANDRILVKDQSAPAQNGIYVVSTLGSGSNGSWSRAADANAWDELPGAYVFVEQGTANGDNGFVCTSDAGGTLGTTAITWTQFSGAGQITAGTGLTKTGNQIDVVGTSGRIVANADSIDLAIAGTAGTYTKVTTDEYGRVTSGTAATAADVGAQAADATLTALAGLDSTAGLVVETAADTFTKRTITGTTRVSVANGNGASGNPTIDLASGVVTPGTYSSVTVDTYGRVTAGSGSSSAAPSFTGTNGEASAIVIGTPVYISGADTVRKALANAQATKDVVGLQLDVTVAAAASGTYQTEGPLTATTGQWDAVTGQTGGLTSGATYYLDNTTAGRLTTTAPSSGFICAVGKALSTTKMLVRLGASIQL